MRQATAHLLPEMGFFFAVLESCGKTLPRLHSAVVALVFACRCLAQEPVGPIETLADVKARSHSEDSRKAPVTTEGAVVWREDAPSRFIYIQDGQIGIRVELGPDQSLPVLGDQLRVDGVLEWDERELAIVDARIEVVGHPGVPKAKRVSIASIAAGAANGTRVKVRGFLRHARRDGAGMRVAMDSDGVRVPVRILETEKLAAEDYIGQYGVIEGVASPGGSPGSFEILLDSFQDLYVRKRPPGDEKTVVPIQDLFRFRKEYTWGDRVRIRGQVVGKMRDNIYVTDGSGGIVVRGETTGNPSKGDWLEAVGFPEFENGHQVFSDAEVVKVAPSVRIKPASVNPPDLLNSSADHRYVTVTGKLVDRMSLLPGTGIDGRPAVTLVMNSGGTVFEVNVLVPDQEAVPETGSLLQVTGVCRVSTHSDADPASFSVLVFAQDDIAVLKGPGFFTERRLLILLCVTLLILTITGFGVLMAVKKNAGLLAEVRERKAITAERARLAGDLHDTLEQMLTAIHLQTHSLSSIDPLPETATEGIISIRELVRQCHLEIRNFVWDLRPAALDRYDLVRALERMAASLVLGTPTRVSVHRAGVGVRIPALVEDNLLRIGQEALTNAVKHGAPTELGIKLVATGENLVLEITDDGSGIPEDTDGFGVRGMKERVRRIGGQLEISRLPEHGTSVRIEVPLVTSAGAG